ncbi:hypothetical protein DFP72DRAFT_1178031 [Ephemerocybe angulata]|uniref:Uncharacterized protein n=1 Tax=Ephemerocybe angulata TaxID=980116 RepID=A0A8H6HAG1_9AGAR|nr:hypothetical protein DFP72DRAFT_1178031 [Tulosesus angulatus]
MPYLARPHIGRFVTNTRYNPHSGLFTVMTTDPNGNRNISKYKPDVVQMALDYDTTIGNDPDGLHTIAPLPKTFMREFNDDNFCRSKFVYQDPTTGTWIIPPHRVTSEVIDLSPLSATADASAHQAQRHQAPTTHQPAARPTYHTVAVHSRHDDRRRSPEEIRDLKRVFDRHDRAFDILLDEREDSKKQRDFHTQRRQRERERAIPHYKQHKKHRAIKPRQGNVGHFTNGQDFYLASLNSGLDANPDHVFNMGPYREPDSPLHSPPSPSTIAESTLANSEGAATSAITLDTIEGESLEVGTLSLDEAAKAFDINQIFAIPAKTTIAKPTKPKLSTTDALKGLNFRRSTRSQTVATEPGDQDEESDLTEPEDGDVAMDGSGAADKS